MKCKIYSVPPKSFITLLSQYKQLNHRVHAGAEGGAEPDERGDGRSGNPAAGLDLGHLLLGWCGGGCGGGGKGLDRCCRSFSSWSFKAAGGLSAGVSYCNTDIHTGTNHTHTHTPEPPKADRAEPAPRSPPTHRGLEDREDEREGEEHLDEQVAGVEGEGRVPKEIGRHEALGQEGAAEAADHLLVCGWVDWGGEYID
jgi:hypothetical protein